MLVLVRRKIRRPPSKAASFKRARLAGSPRWQLNVLGRFSVDPSISILFTTCPKTTLQALRQPCTGTQSRYSQRFGPHRCRHVGGGEVCLQGRRSAEPLHLLRAEPLPGPPLRGRVSGPAWAKDWKVGGQQTARPAKPAMCAEPQGLYGTIHLKLRGSADMLQSTVCRSEGSLGLVNMWGQRSLSLSLSLF